MSTIRIARPRTVVVEKVILDQYEADFIDFEPFAPPTIHEAKSTGNVYVNGVLWKGAQLSDYSFVGRPGEVGRATIVTRFGKFVTQVERVVLVHDDTDVPGVRKVGEAE